MKHSSSDDALREDFKKFLIALADRTTREVKGYNPTKFRSMVNVDGAVETAETLIRRPKASSGYIRLLEADRFDLTLEYVVLKNKKYHPLFLEEDLIRCRQRLGERAPPT